MTDKEKSQSQRFVEKARELGCDDSEEHFREAMRRVAKAMPKEKKITPPKPSKRKSE